MFPDRFRPRGRPRAAPVRRCRAAAASPRCAPRPRSAPRWRPPCCRHRPGGGTPRPDRPGAWRRGHCSRPAKLLRPPRYPRSCGRARGGPLPARPRRPVPASRQGRRGLCRAAEFLRLLVGLAQPAPAGPEARLPRTGVATRSHFRPAQLFRARFRRVRPHPFPLRTGGRLLIQHLPVARRAHRLGSGRRPNPAVTLDQRQIGAKILVENRHASDDSAWQNMLPSPLVGPRFEVDDEPGAARQRPERTVTIARLPVKVRSGR